MSQSLPELGELGRVKERKLQFSRERRGSGGSSVNWLVFC